MDSDAAYARDGINNIIDLMRETFGEYFKAYFNGEPINIPQTYWPCLIVSESTGSIQSNSTATDLITETITIMVVLNKKDYLQSGGDIDLSEVEIRRLVKGQDASTPYPHQYIQKSIMYALRTNFTLDNTVIANETTTEFGEGVRFSGAGDSLRELATQEARVTMTIKRLAIVPQRNQL